MRPRTLPLVVVSLVVALGACGDAKRETRAGSTPSIPNAAALLPSAPGSTPGATPGTPSGAGATTVPSPGPTDVGPSPAPIPSGSIEDDVPVEATITPSCVIRGRTAKITITTEPKNAVAYHAVYAGTKGGAPPPFGYGYGGDDRGHANEQGIWTGTWIVRIDAPVGPARADVIAADGDSFGYDDPPFYVAASPSGCPA